MRAGKLCAGLWLFTAACRFGGPSESAIELVEPVEDAGVDAGEQGEIVSPPDPPPALHDAAVPPAPPGDGGSASAACGPSTVPGCDPVRGPSCIPGISQCLVDPAPPEPAGRCVFSGMPTPSGCEENDLYSTCPPLFTCKQGECRKYCYCDADCDPGDVCSEPSGQGNSPVFKLCLQTRP